MPGKSGSKRERQYEHIKESAEERGASTGRAKELAGRTVNKKRAQAGEAKSSSGSGGSSRSGGSKSSGGSGGSKDSGSSKTRDELYAEARKRGIEGRSSMNKQELARALGR
ncbi:Rho termination factor N-terminal domain-containing protein [Streptomyces xinghaiensis]|uniref:Rho termination factor N-terminal domain-containing protein n=1 Tax=Streptomyces xinghaiensis TaxID=1038928 RepID=UPI002E0F45D2|nr:Rho termination factor N-terminal domain-containing protein [Streptomyces xinghaiensis]